MGRTNRRDSRERHGDDSTELLRRYENEEAGCVDAVSRHQMGWAPFRSAIGRLRDPNFAAGVVFPRSVHFTVRPSGNVDADYRNSSGRDLRAALPVVDAVARIEDKGNIAAAIVIVADVDAALEFASGRVVDAYHIPIREAASVGYHNLSPRGLPFFLVRDSLVTAALIGDESLAGCFEVEPRVVAERGGAETGASECFASIGRLPHSRRRGEVVHAIQKMLRVRWVRSHAGFALRAGFIGYVYVLADDDRRGPVRRN